MNDIVAATFQVLRVPIAVVLIGYLPGAMLMYWILPPQSLNRIERFCLSTLASLCLATLTAYALARSRDGLTGPDLFLWLLEFSLVFLVAANVRWHYRDRKITQSYSEEPAFRRRFPKGPALRRLAGGIVLAGAIIVAIVVNYNPVRYGLTEFYVAPQNYGATGVQYARRANTLMLPVEVVNHENRAASYRFEAWLEDHRVPLADRPRLGDGERWANELAIPLDSTDNINRVDILLFIDPENPAAQTRAEQAEPVARLRLWLQDESTLESERR